MTIDADKLAQILEAAMLVAGKPTTLNQFESLFADEPEKPSREEIKTALTQLQENYESRGIELVEVASGFRLQAKQSFTPWLTHLYQEKAPRYSRALLETLVLIAYRQPITRGEIEDVRGVAVSSNIVKTLIEREWVRVLGHRDVPGRPALLGTTRQFLDYFNLKRIDELPTLSEIKDLDQIDPELAKEMALLQPEEGEVDLQLTEDGADGIANEVASEEIATDETDTTADLLLVETDASTDNEVHAQTDKAADTVPTDTSETDDQDATQSSVEVDQHRTTDPDATMSETVVPDLDLNLGDDEPEHINSGNSSANREENGHAIEESVTDETDEALSLSSAFSEDEEFADSTQHEARNLAEVSESETVH